MARSLRKPTARCPICKAAVVPEHRPFCSARCADVDLARWLGEDYRIPAVEQDDSVLGGDAEDED